MNFIKGLFGSSEKSSQRQRATDEGDAQLARIKAERAVADAEAAIEVLPVQKAMPRDKSGADVNIWDLEGADGDDTPVVQPKPVATGKSVRANRTRLIGFENAAHDVSDAFDDAEAARPVERVRYPVGWVLVTSGPGRGYCFALVAGMSQIGRGEDQAICLDFGDNAISRNNHAAIVYDEAERKFLLGHGGKANIVRLNGKPVISNEDLKDGDEIHIGDTTLELVTLTDRAFDWIKGDDGEDQDDVAIA